ncbi:MAG: hypothetical protein KDA92_26655 [Planctomycetales bacterium]|nr:hypothetical protein [Planctomycetales bacterium]
MTETNEKLAAIRHNMCVVRDQLSDEVDDAIQQAKDVVDWRNYVREHPLLTFGVASAVGFLLVPKRRQNITVLQADGADVRRALKEQRDADKPTLASMAVSALSALAFRKAMAIAQAKAETWLIPPQAQPRTAAPVTATAGSSPHTNGDHIRERRDH